MQVLFNEPTLVTITAPTCAGKNYLLDGLDRELGFVKLIGTTTRGPRLGEIEGSDYYFITEQQSKQMELDREFAELVTYNGIRYGVTHAEMESKLSTGKPVVVILEPLGLFKYREYCNERRIKLFSIFVHTPEGVRLDRLANRTTSDIIAQLQVLESVSADFYKRRIDAVKRVVEVNNKRLAAIIEQERGWQAVHHWDVIVDGTDVWKALHDVKAGVKYRNDRQDVVA
jgi:guanylate kinase